MSGLPSDMISASLTLRRCVMTLALVFAVFSLAGCYQADFPLGSPKAGTIDGAILGQWRCVQGGRSENSVLLITAMSFDEKQYYVELNTAGEKPLRYRAFSTAIEGERLLNLQELDVRTPVPQRKWVFVRYTLLKPNILQVELVKDEALKGVGPSPSAVRDFMERNVTNRELYRDFCVCTREVEKN